MITYSEAFAQLQQAETVALIDEAVGIRRRLAKLVDRREPIRKAGQPTGESQAKPSRADEIGKAVETAGAVLKAKLDRMPPEAKRLFALLSSPNPLVRSQAHQQIAARYPDLLLARQTASESVKKFIKVGSPLVREALAEAERLRAAIPN